MGGVCDDQVPRLADPAHPVLAAGPAGGGPLPGGLAAVAPVPYPRYCRRRRPVSPAGHLFTARAPPAGTLARLAGTSLALFQVTARLGSVRPVAGDRAGRPARRRHSWRSDHWVVSSSFLA